MIVLDDSERYRHRACRQVRDASPLPPNGRVKDRLGAAIRDYSPPCPGCSESIVKGQLVRKVDEVWWHEACRAEYRAGLGLTSEPVALQAPGGVL
jgi:hypothetical protein